MLEPNVSLGEHPHDRCRQERIKAAVEASEVQSGGGFDTEISAGSAEHPICSGQIYMNGGFHKWGYPHSWMVYFRENPNG